MGIMAEASSAAKRKFAFPPDEQLLKACSSSGRSFPRNREYFEDVTKRVSWVSALWIKYARFEESNNELTRAREVYERSLQAIILDPILWLSYAKFEIRHGFLDRARLVFNRAIDMVPDCDGVWLSYISMEEKAGADIAVLRQIFETWVTGRGNCTGPWGDYADFELRRSGIDKARQIYDRLLHRPFIGPFVWINYAQFEIKNGDVASVRECFDRALYADDRNRECEELFLLYKEFEIQHKPLGWKKQRSLMYEEELAENPLEYGAWFEYTQLVEGMGDNKQTRKLYGRALANPPASHNKLLWKDYIYLWIHYAVFEELKAQDFDQARHVYRECLSVIPHDKFSFAKCWLLAAEFEIRQLKLNDARYILDNALAKVPKDKIFKKYISFELELGEVDRCRKLYAKYLEWAPENDRVWISFAKMEYYRGEIERARAIYELAIAQPGLASPEILWNAYISHEECEGNLEKARELYGRELENKKQHVCAWIRYATFEARNAGRDGADQSLCLHRARNVLREGLRYFRALAPNFEKERNRLLREWRVIERDFGCLGDVKVVGEC